MYNDYYYIPKKSDSKCTRVIDRHTLRVYIDNFVYNQNIRYYDVYLDEHYMTSQIGTEYYWYNDQYNHATFPACLDNTKITDDYYYRNDFDGILIITLIILLFVVYLPYKIISRMFGRWLKI